MYTFLHCVTCISRYQIDYARSVIFMSQEKEQFPNCSKYFNNTSFRSLVLKLLRMHAKGIRAHNLGCTVHNTRWPSKWSKAFQLFHLSQEHIHVATKTI